MHALSRNRVRLMHHLGNMGLEQDAILEFVWTLKSLFLVNPGMDNIQINTRLNSLGWSDFRLDDETFDLAASCFVSVCKDTKIL